MASTVVHTCDGRCDRRVETNSFQAPNGWLTVQIVLATMPPNPNGTRSEFTLCSDCRHKADAVANLATRPDFVRALDKVNGKSTDG